MADDFGDDAGDKLLDWSIRLIIEHGRGAAQRQSSTLAQALRNAQGQIGGNGGTPAAELAGQGGWAKLDLHEFVGIEGWDELRGIIGDSLEGRGITHEWFDDEEGGSYLLFRTGDACELSEALGSIAEQAEAAQGRAEAVVERSRQASRGEPDACRGQDDPRAKMSLREKVRAVREYAGEISRAERGAREPGHEVGRERQRT